MIEDAASAIVQFRRKGGANAGPQRLALMAAIAEHGSIAGAARATGLSYKGAWDAVQALNNLFERPLIAASPGGVGGGVAQVTNAGQNVLAAYRAIEDDLAQLVDRLYRAVADDDPANLLWRLSMKTSARNMLRGRVASVTDGAVNAEVVLDVGDGIEIVAIVTRESVVDLGLVAGREALALIKASFVLLAAGDAPLATSARNSLAGTVASHVTGAVNDEIVIDIGGGKTITATVTRGSGEALGLQPGSRARALIKASHVILAVD